MCAWQTSRHLQAGHLLSASQPAWPSKRQRTSPADSALCVQDWLKAWDHCFTAGPAFFYYLLAAHLLQLKPLLLACSEPQQLASLLATPPPVDVNKLLVAAYRLQRATPELMVVGATKVAPLAKGELYQQFTEYPKVRAGASMSEGAWQQVPLHVAVCMTSMPAYCTWVQRMAQAHAVCLKHTMVLLLHCRPCTPPTLL